MFHEPYNRRCPRCAGINVTIWNYRHAFMKPTLICDDCNYVGPPRNNKWSPREQERIRQQIEPRK
jgi:hypothetical protein